MPKDIRDFFNRSKIEKTDTKRKRRIAESSDDDLEVVVKPPLVEPSAYFAKSKKKANAPCQPSKRPKTEHDGHFLDESHQETPTEFIPKTIKTKDQPKKTKEVAKPKEPPKKPKETPKKTKTAQKSSNSSVSTPKNPTKDATDSKPPNEERRISGYREFLNRTGPSAPGTKEIPEGATNCLSGLTFVMTGEFSSLSRDDVTELIRRYGGRMTSAVSGKTSYLLVGDQPGNVKINKAKALSTPNIGEDEFIDIIRKRPAVSDEQVESKKSKTQIKNEQSVASISNDSPVLGQLWTEKYKPTKVSEIIGNKGNVEKLNKWLECFDESRKLNFKFSGLQNSTHLRAALLSGPPGVGKTTAAHVVAKSLGYDIIEFNASTMRSKKSLHDVIPHLLGSRTLFSYSKEFKHPTSVVIMDEVDGMSTADRGGLAELTLLIKKSKSPVICICNDRSNQKLRTLAGLCLDLRFRRPEANLIRSRLMTICYREGLKIEGHAIDSLVALTQADIRQTINLLSSYRLNSLSLGYDDARTHGQQSIKDVVAPGPFETIAILFSHFRQQSFRNKMHHYFTDYDLVPLFVQENYIHCESANNEQTMLELSRAADFMSFGNLIDTRMREFQNWELMNSHNVMSTVAPAMMLTGRSSAKYNFPSLLGNLSRATKGNRLLRELCARVAKRSRGLSRTSVRLDLVSYFGLVSKILITQERFPELFELMDAYFFERDTLSDVVAELGVGICSKEAVYSSIPPQAKRKFTRNYNNANHPEFAFDMVPKKISEESDAE